MNQPVEVIASGLARDTSQATLEAYHSLRFRLTLTVTVILSVIILGFLIILELRYNLLSGLGIVLIVAIIMNLWLDRMVLRRLDQLMGAVRDFGVGNLSLRVPARGTDEISRLDAAFNDMARSLEVKEQETGRLYRELQQKEVARAQLLQQIIQVQEEERKRIARDLHDDFAQTLTALTIGLETVLQALPDSMAMVGRQISRVQALTMTTLGQTHRWIQDLRPRVLDDLGLVPAIR